MNDELDWWEEIIGLASECKSPLNGIILLIVILHIWLLAVVIRYIGRLWKPRKEEVLVEAPKGKTIKQKKKFKAEHLWTPGEW